MKKTKTGKKAVRIPPEKKAVLEDEWQHGMQSYRTKEQLEKVRKVASQVDVHEDVVKVLYIACLIVK